MDKKVRAKFKCTSEKKMESWDKQKSPFFYEYEFSVVCSGNEENKKFFASTPGGTVKITAIAESLFVPGKEYYLDFLSAE
ncbi:MAG: hypothetical protein ABFD50_18910 [Smithella sp.]